MGNGGNGGSGGGGGGGGGGMLGGGAGGAGGKGVSSYMSVGCRVPMEEISWLNAHIRFSLRKSCCIRVCCLR